jgi:hypothetical protein
MKSSGVYPLCLIVLIQTIAGCGTMTEQQTSSAVGGAVGAGVGAVAGGVLDKKNPGRGAAIGAATGAALGAGAGWAVGEYRVRQVRAREQAAAEAGYTPAQGIVTKIEKAAATPQQLKPGDRLTFQAQYTVLAPPQTKEVKVTESRTIYFDNRHLIDLPQKSLTLAQGTNEIQDSMSLPKDAAEGLYLMTTSVEPVVANAQKAQVSTPFIVRSAAIGARAAQPAAQPQATVVTVAPPRPAAVEASAVPPTVQAPRLVAQTLFVKIGLASIREGAGSRFRLLSQAPKGTKLQVLEAGGTDADRWFRVKLPNGQEGWVAASAVSLDP